MFNGFIKQLGKRIAFSETKIEFWLIQREKNVLFCHQPRLIRESCMKDRLSLETLCYPGCRCLFQLSLSSGQVKLAREVNGDSLLGDYYHLR